MNHKGVEYTLTRSETPGFWQWQFRIGDLPGQVGKDRGKAFPAGHAPRPVEDRSRTEARDAPIDLVIGIRAGYFPASLRTFQMPNRAP